MFILEILPFFLLCLSSFIDWSFKKLKYVLASYKYWPLLASSKLVKGNIHFENVLSSLLYSYWPAKKQQNIVPRNKYWPLLAYFKLTKEFVLKT